MARVKIKTKNNRHDRRTKLKLLEVLAPANVFRTLLHEALDAIIVTTVSDTEADKIFEPAIKKKFEEKGFTLILPYCLQKRNPGEESSVTKSRIYPSTTPQLT